MSARSASLGVLPSPPTMPGQRGRKRRRDDRRQGPGRGVARRSLTSTATDVRVRLAGEPVKCHLFTLRLAVHARFPGAVRGSGRVELGDGHPAGVGGLAQEAGDELKFVV